MNEGKEKPAGETPRPMLGRKRFIRKKWSDMIALIFAIFVLWIYSPFPYSLDIFVIEASEIVTIVIGFSVVLEVINRFVAPIRLVFVAVVISLLFLALDATSGALDTTFKLWASVGLPTLILGTLLDNKGAAIPFQKALMSPIQSNTGETDEPLSPKWFYGHLFTWCLFGSIIFQVIFAGKITDLANWISFLMASITPTLVAGSIAYVFLRKVRHDDEINDTVISRILKSIFAVSLISACCLVFHSTIVLTGFFAGEYGLRAPNHWAVVIVFAVSAAVLSYVLRNIPRHWESEAWYHLLPTVIAMVAFVWFIAVGRHSPSLSATLTVAAFIVFKILDGIVQKEMSAATRSIRDGLINATLTSVPITLALAIASFIHAIIRHMGVI